MNMWHFNRNILFTANITTHKGQQIFIVIAFSKSLSHSRNLWRGKTF